MNVNIFAKSPRLRRRVTFVMCRPAFGSTAQKIFAVPRRTYSPSLFRTCPDLFIGIVGLISERSCTDFSSKQTTGASGSTGLAYRSNRSSIRLAYSGVISGMHHIFFPPWLQLMAGQQDANTFSTDAADDSSSDYLLGNQTNRPPRMSRGRMRANHRDDGLALPKIKS